MTTASPHEIARKLGSGLLSFPVTHLREDGSFDEPAYRENIGWLGQFDASGRSPRPRWSRSSPPPSRRHRRAYR